MLIIEGSDLVGKTTLAKKLVMMGTPMGPLIYRSLGILPGDWDYDRDYTNMMSYNVVCDRMYLSEIVYGALVRGYTLVKDAQVKKLTEMVEMYAGMHLIITADNSVLEKNHKARGDDTFNFSTIVKANEAFIDLVPKLQNLVPLLHYHIKPDGKMPADNQDLISNIHNLWFSRLRVRYTG